MSQEDDFDWDKFEEKLDDHFSQPYSERFHFSETHGYQMGVRFPDYPNSGDLDSATNSLIIDLESKLFTLPSGSWYHETSGVWMRVIIPNPEIFDLPLKVTGWFIAP
jgi:hypothetical protein